MDRLKSNFKNMFLSLLIICVVVAVLLAQMNNITEKPIAAAKAQKLENAIKEVVPAFDNNPVAESFSMADEATGDSLLIYPAKKGGELVGFAIKSFTKKGFSGRFDIMVGFDTKNTLINYSVLEHAETPGLGSKMVEWFKDKTKAKQNVLGRDLSKGELKVSKDGGEIDAITASTITSRAFLDAVNRAYKAYVQSQSKITTKQ